MGLDKLAPWDAARWFETPRQRNVALTGSARYVPLLPTETRRVAWMLSAGTATQLVISLDPSVSQAQGIFIYTGNYPFSMTEADFGPLCAQAWWVFDSAAGSVTVVEVLLREWPEVPRGIEHEG